MAWYTLPLLAPVPSLVSSHSCQADSAQVPSLPSPAWVVFLYFREVILWKLSVHEPIFSARLWNPWGQGLCFLQFRILRILSNTTYLLGTQLVLAEVRRIYIALFLSLPYFMFIPLNEPSKLRLDAYTKIICLSEIMVGKREKQLQWT